MLALEVEELPKHLSKPFQEGEKFYLLWLYRSLWILRQVVETAAKKITITPPWLEKISSLLGIPSPQPTQK